MSEDVTKAEKEFDIDSLTQDLFEGGEKFTLALSLLNNYLKTFGYNKRIDPALSECAGWLEVVLKLNNDLSQILKDCDIPEEEEPVTKEIKVDSIIIAKFIKKLIPSEYEFGVRVVYSGEQIIVQITYENSDNNIYYHTKMIERFKDINWDILSSYLKTKFFKPTQTTKFIVGEARIPKNSLIFKGWLEEKIKEAFSNKFPNTNLTVTYI